MHRCWFLRKNTSAKSVFTSGMINRKELANVTTFLWPTQNLDTLGSSFPHYDHLLCVWSWNDYEYFWIMKLCFWLFLFLSLHDYSVDLGSVTLSFVPYGLVSNITYSGSFTVKSWKSTLPYLPGHESASLNSFDSKYLLLHLHPYILVNIAFFNQSCSKDLPFLSIGYSLKTQNPLLFKTTSSSAWHIGLYNWKKRLVVFPPIVWNSESDFCSGSSFPSTNSIWHIIPLLQQQVEWSSFLRVPEFPRDKEEIFTWVFI